MTKNWLKLAIKSIVVFSMITAVFYGSTLPVVAEDPLTVFDIRIVSVSDKIAVISWQTNRSAKAKFDFGRNSGEYSWQSNLTTQQTTQQVTLNGLTPNATYFFRITAYTTDEEAVSFERSFTTNESTDNEAPIIRSVHIAYLTGTTATIQWQTNEEATTEVQFGVSDTYGSTRTDNRLMLEHDITLTGLKPGTLYHFLIKSKDKKGNIARWQDLTFRTFPTETQDKDQLLIYDVQPSSQNNVLVDVNNVTVSWRTNRLSEGWVNYGPSDRYGKQAKTLAPRDFYHTLTLTDLLPDTTYYFEINARDVFNRTVKVNGFSFRTKPVLADQYPQPDTSSTGRVLGTSLGELLIYLPFDEGTGDVAKDESFNNNNGTLDANQPPVWGTGQYGTALNFLGNRENVRVADNETIRFRNSVSMLAWIKVSKFGRYNKIVSKEDAYELILGPNDGTLRIALFPEGANDWVTLNTPGRPVEKDEWTFVAGTYDGQTMRLYVDGKEVGTNVTNIDINNSTQPMYIGGDVVNRREWFNGAIDDVAIFSYALTKDEVADVYASGVARYLVDSGIATVNNDVPPPTGGEGQVLGAATGPIPPARPAYACDPNRGYTKMTKLYKTTESPDIWAILETGQRHYITSPAAFAKYGCSWGAVQVVSRGTLERYPLATLVRTPENPKVFHLFSRPDHKWLKLPLPSPTVFISYPGNYWGNIARVDQLDINAYPDAKLMKTDASPSIYLIENGLKRLVPSMEVFKTRQFEVAEIVTVSQIHLDSFDSGATVQ